MTGFPLPRIARLPWGWILTGLFAMVIVSMVVVLVRTPTSTPASERLMMMDKLGEMDGKLEAILKRLHRRFDKLDGGMSTLREKAAIFTATSLAIKKGQDRFHPIVVRLADEVAAREAALKPKPKPKPKAKRKKAR